MLTGKKYMIAALALLLLAGCRTRHAYTGPDFDPGNLFRYQDQYDSATIADLSWRDFFTDSLLVDLIERGLEQNLDLAVAYARIRSAEANLEMARKSFFPTVSLVGQVNESLVSNGSKGRRALGYSSPQYSLGITSAWEADLWGRLAYSSRSQYAAYLQSIEYAWLVQTSLIANIATTYYTLLALDQQLEITRRTSVLLAESTETMQALMDAGVLTGASVQQSRALYYATVVTIPDLETNIVQTENSLCLLVGEEPHPIARGSLQMQPFMPELQYGVPSQALARRPDVRQAELALRSAFELTGAARAAFYPSISLGSGSLIGYAATSLSNFFRPEHLMATIIGQLAQPLFAQGQLRGNLKIAQAREQEALMNFYTAVLTAGEEVSNYVFQYRKTIDKMPLRDAQIEALETAVYYAQELLVAGEANYTEVLTAEQNLLSARLNQVSDRLTQLQVAVNLYRALGGGVI